MELLTQTDMVRFIADHYGISSQLAQSREECAELIVATSKYDRAKTEKARVSAEESLAEEMADVTIMLAQLEYLLGNHTEVGYHIQRKLNRQIQRIQEEANDPAE